MTVNNDRVEHLNGVFGRSMPIWEGHTRDRLDHLRQVELRKPGLISDGFLTFVYATTAKFTASDHGIRFISQIEDRGGKRARGSAVHIQEMARHLLDEPDHRGVAKSLQKLVNFVRERKDGFAEVKLDLKARYGMPSILETSTT